MHRQRFLTHGTTDATPRTPRQPCRFPDCHRQRKSLGYCGTHYIQLRTRGDEQLLTESLPGHRGGWPTGVLRSTIDEKGYVRLQMMYRDGDKWKLLSIREHVHVMQRHLGRPLDPKNESVHHRNGNRADNRLENLELFATHSHGSGQSVDDLHAEITRLRARVAELEAA